MKLRFFVSALLAGCILSLSTGCAVLTKGRTQAVVVRSNPEGANVFINGENVGKAPLRVELKRASAYNVVLRKAGFEDAPTMLLPVGNEYASRFLRWGVDVDAGATLDLTPGELVVDLRSAISQTVEGDRFTQMTYNVMKADALLAAKEISPADHKRIVGEIVKFYSN